MDLKINLHITVDEAVFSNLTKMFGWSTTQPGAIVPMAAVTKKEVVTQKITASVEELREAASKLMVTNKAALKELLTKYNAKTVAALAETDYAGFLADIKAVK